MGVYIPPPDDGSKGTTREGMNHPNDTANVPKWMIPSANRDRLIPTNPSIGLFWGPLVPASDNRPALYFMTALQFASGIYFLHRGRRILKIPPAPPAFKRSKAVLPLATFNFLLGITLTFGCGLEVMRLNVPFDPWQAEAKVFRQIAISKGDKPTSWFGAYKWFTPVSLDTWTEQSKRHILAADRALQELEHPGTASGNNGGFTANNGIVTHPKNGTVDITAATGAAPVGEILVKMHNNSSFSEIYNKLSDTNIRRMAQLKLELKDVTESNASARLELISQGKTTFVNPNFLKPPITLGNHPIEEDSDFELAWLNFDPWDELKLDTDSEIRLVPSCPEKHQEEFVGTES